VSGPTAAAKINGHDGIDGLAVNRVVLAHADPAIAVLIDHAVGVTPMPHASRRLGRERPRLGPV
jgi:hypothetical protein